MQCVTHPSIEATCFCRICGRAMCNECKRDVRGTIYCENCLQREVQGPPVPTAGAVGHHGPIPGLALGLGFIPGVGAIYNGQYAKAFVHIVIFGTIVSILSSGEAGGFQPLFAIVLAGFVIYMAFEAFHTASKVSRGEPVDEWSGMFNTGGAYHAPVGTPINPVDGSPMPGAPPYGAPGAPPYGAPVAPVSTAAVGARAGGAIVLIVLGSIFLLSNFGYLSFHQVFKFWPLILIGVGATMLASRLGEGRGGQ